MIVNCNRINKVTKIEKLSINKYIFNVAVVDCSKMKWYLYAIVDIIRLHVFF